MGSRSWLQAGSWLGLEAAQGLVIPARERRASRDNESAPAPRASRYPPRPTCSGTEGADLLTSLPLTSVLPDNMTLARASVADVDAGKFDQILRDHWCHVSLDGMLVSFMSTCHRGLLYVEPLMQLIDVPRFGVLGSQVCPPVLMRKVLLTLEPSRTVALTVGAN